MWSIIREFLTYFIFLTLLYFVTYSNMNQNAFLQVNHFKKFLLNSRQINNDYTQVCISLLENEEFHFNYLDLNN